jgi:hypothetical protein
MDTCVSTSSFPFSLGDSGVEITKERPQTRGVKAEFSDFGPENSSLGSIMDIPRCIDTENAVCKALSCVKWDNNINRDKPSDEGWVVDRDTLGNSDSFFNTKDDSPSV